MRRSTSTVGIQHLIKTAFPSCIWKPVLPFTILSRCSFNGH